MTAEFPRRDIFRSQWNLAVDLHHQCPFGQVTVHARLPPVRTKSILAGLAILPAAAISWMIDPTTSDTHTYTQPNEEIYRKRPVVAFCHLGIQLPTATLNTTLLFRKEKRPPATSTHVALLISYRRPSRPRVQLEPCLLLKAVN
ncbi:hypothetical protein QC763_0012580 [Podospora pseudopauciseta]|uniref:Uncharacterized protein n=1 Tax=Podospora pseudopauciseta TaxID=2093780 RepID=A0ABR0HYV7_9PEZI|nr:hypothetical protein QC763_0012580 [Podospora pseudopauciseta]